MRIIRVPAAYATWIEGEVSRAADEARNDAFRRANGDPPLIPDVFLDEATGTDAIVAIDTVVIVATPSDALPDVVRKVTAAVRPPRQRSA